MPPAALRSAAYPGAKKLGRGQGYVYPHTDERGFAVDCLPEELAGTVYYEPSGIGDEVEKERSARALPRARPRTAPE
jgi:putative ATPase